MSLTKTWTNRIAAAIISAPLLATPALAQNWNIYVNRDGTACGGVSVGNMRLGGCSNNNGGFNGRGSAKIGNGRISVPITTQGRKTFIIGGDRYSCPVKRNGKPDVPKCTPTR